MDQLQRIQSKIYEIRGQRVMLDRDLAEMYGVETRVLNQAVRRNKERFPDDFMFQLNDKEMQDWRSQIVMSNSIKMGVRRNLYAFTELGVADYNDINEQTGIQLDLIDWSLAQLQVDRKRDDKPSKRIGFVQDDDK